MVGMTARRENGVELSESSFLWMIVGVVDVVVVMVMYLVAVYSGLCSV